MMLSDAAWALSHLRMSNKILSGYFRSAVDPVSHLVAPWRQHCPATLLERLPCVSSPSELMYTIGFMPSCTTS